LKIEQFKTGKANKPVDSQISSRGISTRATNQRQVFIAEKLDPVDMISVKAAGISSQQA